MRRGFVTLVALSIAGAVAAQAAGAGATGTTASAGHDSLSKQIPLPAAGPARIVELTVTEKASRGAVGSLGVSDSNDAQLPPGVRAIAVVDPSSSAKHSATFKVYVAINNLPAGTVASAAESGIIVVKAKRGGPDDHVFKLTDDGGVDCAKAVALGNAVDAAFQMTKSGTVSYGRYRLLPQRKSSVQPSV